MVSAQSERTMGLVVSFNLNYSAPMLLAPAWNTQSLQFSKLKLALTF